MMRNINIISSGVAAFLLAACGGGGDEKAGTPAEVVASGDLTSQNYANTANATFEIVKLGFAAGDGFDRVYAASAEAGSAASVLDVASLQRQLVEKLSKRPTTSGREQAAAVSNERVPCSGGGYLNLSFTYASEEQDTRGDKLQVTPVDCIEAGQPVTGSMEMMLNEVIDSASRYYRGVGVTASHFGTPAYRADGTSRIELDAYGNFSSSTPTITKEVFKLSFTGLSITTAAPQQTVKLQHGYEFIATYGSTPTSMKETLALSGAVQVGSVHYRLEQKQPFVMSSSSGDPQSGEGMLHLIDKDGDRVEVTAGSDRFRYTYYTAGSSTPAAGPVDGPAYSQL